MPPDPPEPPFPPGGPLPPPRGPRPVPPAPPPPELLRPASPHVPLTPMMDFLQRRLESLETELQVERERSQSAHNLLTQQDSMREQVESQLKAMADQLRREKSERDNEETRSHSRGRIDALEKRLDEMHQTWAGLLKEAVAGGGRPEEWSKVKDEMARIKDSLALVPQAVGELRDWAARAPADELRVEERLGAMVTRLAGSLHDQMAEWDRRRGIELEHQKEGLRALERERAALQEAWEGESRSMRNRDAQERLLQEKRLDEKVRELDKSLAAIKEGQSSITKDSQEVRALLGRAVDALTAEPKARDQVIADLEEENRAVVKSLRERGESMRRFAEERRQIEASMGASLIELTGAVEAEREKTREAARAASGWKSEIAALQDRLSAAERALHDKDALLDAARQERDSLLRSVVEHASQLRSHVDQNLKDQQASDARLRQFQAQAAAEKQKASEEAAFASDLKAKLGALSQEVARLVMERDASGGRQNAWEGERAQLMETLRKKEEMLGLLSSTFQNLIKKP